MNYDKVILCLNIHVFVKYLCVALQKHSLWGKIQLVVTSRDYSESISVPSRFVNELRLSKAA